MANGQIRLVANKQRVPKLYFLDVHPATPSSQWICGECRRSPVYRYRWKIIPDSPKYYRRLETDDVKLIWTSVNRRSSKFKFGTVDLEIFDTCINVKHTFADSWFSVCTVGRCSYKFVCDFLRVPPHLPLY